MIRGVILLVALAAPAMARADPSPTAAALAAAVRPPHPAITQSVAPFSRPDAVEARAPDLAQTSLEGRLSGRLSGALGFLCGRPDDAAGAGGPSVTGRDPHGRFLGARLSLALR